MATNFSSSSLQSSSTDFSPIVQPPSPDFLQSIPPPSNPYIHPTSELHFYTENFKEFPIVVPYTLPFFPVAIYKIAVIKSVEKIILNAIDNANVAAKEFLERLQSSSQDLKQTEEAVKLGLIKPTSIAMQPLMNLQYFQQQLCWILSEFNSKSGLNVPADQLAAVANILVDENVSTVLDQVASKACKSVSSLIDDLVKEAIMKQSQSKSMQSAKSMFGSYLSPISSSSFLSSLVQPEVISPTYPTVKNIPPEFSNSRRRPSSHGYSSDFVLPSDYMKPF
jgi:hypothetical protein